ncbi:MAG: 2-oxoacid:acceptor oxidoreductase subunit alpha [Candidatus Zixiibacteriota bacterium]
MSQFQADKKDDLSIVLCGEAGQGIQTVEQILTQAFKLSGFNVFATKEYMSRVRGGTNSTEIRISTHRISSFVDKIDILIPLSKGAIKHLEKRTTPDTIILGEEVIFGRECLPDKCKIANVPFNQIATELGDTIYVNIIAAGTVSGLLHLDLPIINHYLEQRFSAKDESVIRKNIEAAEKGYQIGKELPSSGKVEIKFPKTAQAKDEILLSGVEAVALGAMAGGCDFISSYPMSPSTGVWVFLTQHAKDFGIITEQAEDEISAINMAIGAWYAGARGMVTTSGGGFALMVEGLSLAGMLETPVVIHLGQRPGPATGLPTRTEQADLEFALHAGHGEFPRMILAPGTIEDAFSVTSKAFDLADKYQSPVIILTDQYFLDSYYNIPSLDLSRDRIEKHIVKTGKAYKRYELTEDGISPRGIPGFGEGLVSADSDEHDEEGHITEDLDLRTKMVNKRLKKLDLIKQETIPPVLIGNENFKTLIIGWGSTYHPIKEALERLERDDVSFLHFKQVYPLHPDTSDYLRKAQKTVIIENNATSQFGRLIKQHTGFEIQKRILKYNGLPFSVEEVLENLKSFLR